MRRWDGGGALFHGEQLGLKGAGIGGRRQSALWRGKILLAGVAIIHQMLVQGRTCSIGDNFKYFYAHLFFVD